MGWRTKLLSCSALLVVAIAVSAMTAPTARAASPTVLGYIGCAPQSSELAIAAAPLSAEGTLRVAEEGCGPGEVGCKRNACNCGGPGQSV
jgi:hypothetical protein